MVQVVLAEDLGVGPVADLEEAREEVQVVALARVAIREAQELGLQDLNKVLHSVSCAPCLICRSQVCGMNKTKQPPEILRGLFLFTAVVQDITCCSKLMPYFFIFL